MLIDENRGRVQTFAVGKDLGEGQLLEKWVVEAGVWQACYLLPDDDGGAMGERIGQSESTRNGMLVTESTVGGFEMRDQEFLTAERLQGWKSDKVQNTSDGMEVVGWTEDLLCLLNKAEREKVGLA